MYDEPREHDYLDFYLLVIQQVEHIMKVKMTKTNWQYGMRCFQRTPSPRLEFCRMQNLAWMIEFSYKCDSLLHNAWLNIPYVFILFVEMISDKHT